MSEDEYAYLKEGFNPRTLRKDQLRNILLTHGVEYSNDMLKPKLLELYQEQIVPRRAELRARFVDVAASSANIDNATPPQKEKEQRVPRFQAVNEEPHEESPRARRARSRSPRRAPSPSRAKAVKAEAAEAASAPPATSGTSKAKPELLKSEAPVLAPPSEFEEPPKSPKSPRRRRANRKVETSAAAHETETLDIPKEEIKVKVPRSPRRKRAHEETEDTPADESFTTHNVFQNAKPAKKRRSEATRPAETIESVPSSLIPEAKLDIEQYINLPSEPEQPHQPQQPQQQQQPHQQQRAAPPAPVTEADISVDALPLDADFVADLNAEVDRLQQQEGDLYPAAEIQFDQVRESASPAPASPAPAAAAASPRANDTPQQPRRGFIPSLRELSVSRAFAEQMEPYLVPSPAPTPRASLAPEPALNHITVDKKRGNKKATKDSGKDSVKDSVKDTSKDSSKEPSKEPSIDIDDAAQLAADDIHEIVELAKASKFRLPHIPRPHLPRLPRIPQEKLKAWSKTAAYYVFMTLFFLLDCVLVGLGIAFFIWYRNAVASAEFCDVGSASPHVYPVWADYDTGYSVVSKLQSSFRVMLDEQWPQCVPCPEHAHCYQSRIAVCDSGFTQSEHPLTAFGIWPRPPRCLPDWEAQRKVDVLREAGAKVLRERRAEVLCDTPDIADTDAERASAMLTEEVKERVYSHKSPAFDDAEFNDYWQQAIEQLPEKYADVYVVSFDPTSSSVGGSSLGSSLGTNGEKRSNGEIIDETVIEVDGQMLTHTQQNAIYGESAEGTDTGAASAAFQEEEEPGSTLVWLVSRSDAELTLNCRVRRYVVRWFRAHQRKILIGSGAGSLISFTVFFIMQSRANSRRKQKVVDSFVDMLKEQRALADADPSGKTVSYLRASELRNRVPRGQFRAIQDSLEAVEGVRMRQIEIYGEITRIWEWTP